LPNNPTVETNYNRSASIHNNNSVCRSISVASLNVCGLKRKSEFPDFAYLVQKYDIFGAVETKLDIYDVVNIEGYHFINKPRKQKYVRKSGGLGVFIRNDIVKYVEFIDTESEYVLWLKLKKCLTCTNDDVIIGIVYIAPTQSRF
jgi:hypothetical protein